MSIAEQITENGFSDLDSDARITFELPLHEAEALRTWLLKPAADGTTSLDDPVLNGILTKLGRAVDVVRATVNVRREMHQAGLDISHLSDEQVRELGRRVSDAAHPSIRG
jgi:hypothetical protein